MEMTNSQPPNKSFQKNVFKESETIDRMVYLRGNKGDNNIFTNFITHSVRNDIIKAVQGFGEQATPVAPTSSQAELLKVKAKYNFPGNEPEDLAFLKNDTLTILKEEEDQWWMARDNMGKEGMIPVNYVEPAVRQAFVEQATQDTQTPWQAELLKVKAEYNFPGNDPEDLAFHENDILTILKKVGDHWWMARDNMGKEGMIPANYVVPMLQTDRILEPIGWSNLMSPLKPRYTVHWLYEEYDRQRVQTSFIHKINPSFLPNKFNEEFKKTFDDTFDETLQEICDEIEDLSKIRSFEELFEMIDISFNGNLMEKFNEVLDDSNIKLMLIDYLEMRRFMGKAPLNEALSTNAIYTFEEYNVPGSILHYIIYIDDIDVVKHLLKTNIDINIGDAYGETPLHLAVRWKHNDIVKLLLLADHIDVNKTDIFGVTTLDLAVISKNIDIVKLLLQANKIEVNKRGIYGLPPLHLALITNTTIIVELLLQTDQIDVNVTDECKKSPLHFAVKSENIEIVKLLLQADTINVNATNKDKESPLHLAVQLNNIEIVKLLLQVDTINVNATNQYKESPLHLAVQLNNIEIVKLLLQADTINVNATNQGKESLLHLAVQLNNIEIVKLLLQAENINVNGTDKKEYSPLHLAVESKCTDIVKLLLQADTIDVNATNQDKESPLHLAVQLNNIEIVKLLLQADKIDVNATRKYNISPLHLAVKTENTEIVKLLLQAENINVNATDTNDDSPLHLAVESKSTDIVKLLLQTDKIDVNATDRYNESPLHLAVKTENIEIVKLLLQAKNINVNATNKYSESPLYLAVQSKNSDIVKLLLQAGKIDVNATNKYKQSPLHLAILWRNIDIVKLLLQTDTINVNILNKNNVSPLDLAVKTNCIDIVELLRKKDQINVNEKDACRRAPLYSTEIYKENYINITSNPLFNWRRFGRLISMSGNYLNDIEDTYKYNYERVYQCITSKKKKKDWKFWRDMLLDFEKGGEILDLIENKYESEINFNGKDTDITFTQLFNRRRFGRLIRMTEKELDDIEHTYKNTYEKIYHCVNHMSSKDKTIDWKFCRKKMLNLGEAGEIVDIIERKFHTQLNLNNVNKNNNKVHKCINRKEELVIVAHNANIKDNFKLLPFKLKRLEFLFLENHSEIKCNTLGIINEWLTNNMEGGFAIKGYDVQHHLKHFYFDYYNNIPYKDSYILVYLEKYNTILHIDTDPADINTSISYNRANIRYLRTVHQCLVGKFIVFIPITLLDENTAEICERCDELQLVVTKQSFRNGDLLKEWLNKIEKSIRKITEVITEVIGKPNHTNDITQKFLNSINSFMYTLDK